MIDVKRKVLYVFAALLILIGAVIGLLYFFGGLKQYIRATSLIKQLPLEKQDTGYADLYANTKGNEYGGILAGVMGNRVWVWGKSGLTSFATDQYSLYWHLSGCVDGEFNGGNAKLPSGEPSMRRINDTGLDTWHNTVKVGDYLVVIKATSAMGGKEGNLREVIGMDWWPFLQADMGVACKK